MGPVLVGLFVDLGPFAKFQRNKICCSVARYMRHGYMLCKLHTICLLFGGGVCKCGSAFDRP